MYKKQITSGIEDFILTIYNFLFEHRKTYNDVWHDKMLKGKGDKYDV